jgi:hypothetical protein
MKHLFSKEERKGGNNKLRERGEGKRKIMFHVIYLNINVW